MGQDRYDVIGLADIYRILLRPKNAGLFCNLRHLSWSFGSLVALAACSGGGGGGGGGGSPTDSGGGRVTQNPQPPQPQTPLPVVQQPTPTPTFPDAVDTAFATSPSTSGYLFNFDESPATVNDFANLQANHFYAYQGDQLFTSDAGVFTTTAAQAASDSTSGNGGTGSQASDFFYGNANANNFNGAGGNDVLIGRGGGDTLTGGAGNDILWGGADTDIMRGEGGDDIILIIGSNPGAYTYDDADLMIEASQLVSRNTDLDLTAVLGLTPAMVNNVATSEAPVGETIEGGAGFNDLIIYGNVDVRSSNVNLRSFGGGNIIINSQLTLSHDQVQDLANVRIIGRDAQSELVISGSGIADFTAVSDVRGMLMIMVESGVTLVVETTQLTMLEEAGDVVRFVGDGAIDFDTNLAAGSLINLIESDDLTITEMGEDLDGDERGGVAGSVAIDSSQGTRIGDSLTAALTDSDNPTITNYEWFRGDTSIASGLSHNTYQLQDADFGNSIRVEITYNDDFGTGKTQAATLAEAVRRDSAGSVAITAPQGTRIGDSLTAALTDSDNPTVTNYEWFRGAESIISGLSHNTYQLQDADFGNSIRVEITYNDDFGNGKTEEATLAEAVRRDSAGSVAITAPQGTRIGDSLTAALTDSDNPTITNYEWFRGDTSIASGLSHNTYQLQNADFGNSIRVEITYNDDFGTGKTQAATLAEAVRRDSAGSVAITAPQGTRIGDMLTAQLTDSDNPTVTNYEWFRGDTSIASGLSHNTYQLQDADFGNSIRVEITYNDDFGTGKTEAAMLAAAVQRDSAGSVAISQTMGLRIGSTFRVNALIDPDITGEPMISDYQWMRMISGRMEIIGTEATYKVVNADATARISVQVTYNDSFGVQTATSETFKIADAAELVGANADDDLRELAKLGNFTGDNPPREAKPIQLDRTSEHGDFVNAAYISEALQDTAVELAVFDFTPFVSNAQAVIDTFNLPNKNGIIFTFASTFSINLNGLFGTYDNAIILINAGNNNKENPFLENMRSSRKIQYERWAEEGRLYFVGGHADGDETTLHENSTHADITKDYYFLSPYMLTSNHGTSLSVQHSAAKIEAAHNAFNQFFDERVSLVETVRILRGTASRFDDPSDDIGLGVIDLRKLLVSDEHGNPIITDGKTALRPLAELRTQANLDPNTGSPIPVAVPVGTTGKLFIHVRSINVGDQYSLELVDPDNPRDVEIFVSHDENGTFTRELGRPEIQDDNGEVFIRVTYNDDFGTQDETFRFDISNPVIPHAFNIRGGYNLGDSLFPRQVIGTGPFIFREADYQWFRNDVPIDSATMQHYELTEADVGHIIKVELTSEFLSETLSAETEIPDNFSETEEVGIYADDDIKALAGLGLFTGDDPANEAKPISVDFLIGEHESHGDLVLSNYQAEALADSAIRQIDLSRVDTHLIRRLPDFNEEFLTYYLGIPNEKHIIFIHANSGYHDLDRYFEQYPDAILLQAADNLNMTDPFVGKEFTEAQRNVYKKWAQTGNLYFVGGHANGNEASIHDLSTHAGETKDFYFLSPFIFTNGVGTSLSVQHTVAKIEAAFNAFNQFFDEPVSLVETARILRGTASNFDNPSDDIGLGVIDLELLLKDDGNGNMVLKTLVELRAQAGLPQEPAPLGVNADDDLRALAALGDFTGDDPASEAKPIQLESFSPHANAVNEIYISEALLDTAVQLVNADSASHADFISAVNALNIPENSHVIFTLASVTTLDLDQLFANYDDPIIFISAGNGDAGNPFLESNSGRSFVKSQYERLAAEGRLYFVGGHAEGNEAILDDKSTHAGITKDYYFLSPYNFGDSSGTSLAVQHFAAKAEAAFNVLNQTYGIRMVEVVRILKGTASHFANPHDELGLGVIDLELLLKDDGNGNMVLKTLVELRMQAKLDVTTGLPIPMTSPGEPAPLPGFSIDPPADEPPAPDDNDFSAPDFSLPPNHYDDFI